MLCFLAYTPFPQAFADPNELLKMFPENSLTWHTAAPGHPLQQDALIEQFPL